MRPRDRQFRIIDMVRTQGKVTVDELVATCAASAETIRRDLTLLAANGKIQKVHGGAMPTRDFGEGPFAQRVQQNGAAKRLIAQKARQLVSPHVAFSMQAHARHRAWPDARRSRRY